MNNDYNLENPDEHRQVPLWLALATLGVLGVTLFCGLAIYTVYDAATPFFSYESTTTADPYNQKPHRATYSSREFSGDSDDTFFFSTNGDGLVGFNAIQRVPTDDRFKTNFIATVYDSTTGERVFSGVNCIGNCESERTEFLPAGDYFVNVTADDDGVWQIVVTAMHK